jgi:hypothetical protein
MIAIKTQTVSVNINGVEFNIDIDVAIKAGIAKPVRTHKIGNYYRDIKTGVIYILMSYGGWHRVSLVPLTGSLAGYRDQSLDVNNLHKITEAEFSYIDCGRVLEQIDNPLVK